NSTINVLAGAGLGGGGVASLGGSTPALVASINHDASLTGNGGSSNLGIAAGGVTNGMLASASESSTVNSVALRDAFGNLTAITFNGNLNGNAASATTAGSAGTATALAATPSQCGANKFSTGIAANGDANCSQPSAANLSNGTSGSGAVLLASAPTMSDAVVNQAANNNDVLSGKRATDSSPTGNFMHFTDFAALNDLFKVDVAGNVAANSFSGDGSGLTGISGANVSNIPNTALQHSSVTINTGSGLSGGGSLSLGGTLTLSNAGVLSVASGNAGISIGGTASNPTV